MSYDLSRLATEASIYASAAGKAFLRGDVTLGRDFVEVARFAIRGIDEAVNVSPDALPDYVRTQLAAIDLRAGTVSVDDDVEVEP